MVSSDYLEVLVFSPEKIQKLLWGALSHQDIMAKDYEVKRKWDESTKFLAIGGQATMDVASKEMALAILECVLWGGFLYFVFICDSNILDVGQRFCGSKSLAKQQSQPYVSLSFQVFGTRKSEADLAKAKEQFQLSQEAEDSSLADYKGRCLELNRKAANAIQTSYLKLGFQVYSLSTSNPKHKTLNY